MWERIITVNSIEDVQSHNQSITQSHSISATLPGMWERTITVGSAGKTFSATGWKLGWGIGPANLIDALKVLHHNCIYTCPTPIQVKPLSHWNATTGD